MHEKKLLEFLQKRRGEEAPTVSEMREALGIRSNSVLYKTLDALERKGFISREKGSWRSISLLTGDIETDENLLISIPLLGIVSAGHPIEAILFPENILVPPGMLSKGHDHFALRVSGDSMIGENILDGDRIVVKRVNTASNGDLVVALIDDFNATVKTFRQSGSKIRLIPANPDYETLTVDARRVSVQGRVVGLLRQY